MAAGLAARQQPPAQSPAAAHANGPAASETDRFAALRESADEARAAYEKLDKANSAEIGRLNANKQRCQFDRVSGLLDRSAAAMQTWLTVEKKYWELWGEVEQKRVEDQQKSLAVMESEQKRAAVLMDEEKKARVDLERRRAALEQSKRTQEIAAQIDGLIKDIQDSEARISAAQQAYDELSTRISNMRTSISARLVKIRQNIAGLEAWELEQTSLYQKQREVAHQVCMVKHPDQRKQTLPGRP
jgi:hypothetical protein